MCRQEASAAAPEQDPAADQVGDHGPAPRPPAAPARAPHLQTIQN